MKPLHDDGTGRVAAMTEIWREVLDKSDINDDSDLFENGGSSLHVLQIVGRVYDVMGADVKIRHVFNFSSPRALSDFLATEAGRSAGSP